MDRRSAWLGLLVSVFLISDIQIAYVIAGVEASQGAEMLLRFSLNYAIIVWVVTDARCRGRIPCYEFGFLAYLFYPLSVIWYAFSSRGTWGLLTLAALCGLLLVPSLSAQVAWNLRYRQ